MTRVDEDFPHQLCQVADVTHASAVLFVADSPQPLTNFLRKQCRCQVILATPSKKTFDRVVAAHEKTIYLPVRAASKLREAQHAVTTAVRAGHVQPGDFIVCGVFQDVAEGTGNLILALDVEPSSIQISLYDLVRLTDGIRPEVLEVTLQIACAIGRVTQRGKRLGALITLGDSKEVLAHSRQLVPNPFRGQDVAARMLTDPAVHTLILELAKLDGAFVVRGDGCIQSAAAFLSPKSTPIQVPAGLGARHVAAATITATTKATAVVVSATDGVVRVFSGGRIVLELDPSIEFEF